MNDDTRPTIQAQAYRHASGVIVICMCCYRALRPDSNGSVWDMVEAFRTSPPEGVSHGLCHDCLDQHYPKLG